MSGQYLRACPLADLAEGETRLVDLEGVPVCLVRTEGEVYAINDTCSHADVSLAEGEVDGTTVECWLHGSRFDLLTGEPIGLPATQPVPVYPVKIEDDAVYVALSPVDAELTPES
jgi:3-phenylpropionate/trans-cinnamate dioxygenase ferredoxin component